MIHRVLRLLGFGLLCGVFALGIARGQGDGFEVSFEEGVVSVQTVDAARSGLAERVSAVRGVLEAVAGAGGTERERLERLLAGLKETDLLWQQVLGAAQRLEGLQQELAGLEQVGRTTLGDVSDAGVGGGGGLGGLGGGDSFLEFDRLIDQLKVAQAKGATVEAALISAEENLREAKDRRDRAERTRRAAKEALGSGEDPGKVGELENAKTDSERARVSVLLRRLELENQRQSIDLHEHRVMLLGAKVQRVRGRVRFEQDDLRAAVGELEKREFNVGRELERAKVNLEYVQGRWFDARQRMEADGGPGGAGGDDAGVVAQVEAKRLARQGRQSQVRSQAKELERLARMKWVWQQRYQVARGTATAEQKASWQDESRGVSEQFERDALLPGTRLVELREDLSVVARRIGEIADGGSEVGRWLLQQRRALQFEVGVWERDLALIGEADGLERKLASEIGAQSVPIGQRLLWVWERVVAVWRFELSSVDDRPITIGKILSGLVLMGLGVWLSRVISAVVGRRILMRVGMNASVAAAIQTVAFYVLVLTFGLFSLHLVNVPLGVFTVLGGAVAIGVGFGSQNAMNNFISGLILLAERPIKINDLVQIGELYGTVHRIGARSTQVRTSANIDIIVPNSAFLEQNVINWTHSDNHVRTHVAVGVAYGSDVARVTDLLLRAATEHGKVLKRPEKPSVLFRDFADNSLVFELHFWIFMRSQMERWKIESEIRYRIDKLFAEAGVVIAFPQRDVHLDAQNPVPVRVVAEQ